MTITKKLQISLSVVLVGFIVWWISFQHVLAEYGTSIKWFDGTYGVFALVGSLIGFYTSKKWGGIKTVLGKSLFLFSLGLFAQEAGQLIYAYYIDVDKIQIPYPSYGDIAYFGSTLLYIAAAIFLAKSIGVKFSLRRSGYKALAIILPLILLVISYHILLYHHHYDTSKPLTVFLDAGYPIGEALYISIAIVAYLLSRKLLGGKLKPAILLILFALLIQYVSDFTFIYQSNRNTWMSGGINDFMYLIAYFVMTSAMIKFLSVNNKLSHINTEHKSDGR